LGEEYANDLFVGFSTPDALGGALFRFELSEDGLSIVSDDPALADLVADNVEPHEMTENESLVFGEGFGIVTDIEAGPDGALYVVSLDQGAVYAISGR
jgi:hypothetical protein